MFTVVGQIVNKGCTLDDKDGLITFRDMVGQTMKRRLQILYITIFHLIIIDWIYIFHNWFGKNSKSKTKFQLYYLWRLTLFYHPTLKLLRP